MYESPQRQESFPDRQLRSISHQSQGEEGGVWDFKGEEDKPQEDGQSKCLVNECL